MVVFGVRVGGNQVPVLVPLELVLAELLRRPGAPLRVNHNRRQPPQPLHGVFHTARRLGCSPTIEAKCLIVRHALGLGAVRGEQVKRLDALLIPKDLGRLLVALPVCLCLVEDVEGQTGRVVVHAVIGPGVRVIAPVNPPVDAVEAAQLLVGDGAQLNILKHVCPAAGDFSQIFVPVGQGV